MCQLLHFKCKHGDRCLAIAIYQCLASQSLVKGARLFSSLNLCNGFHWIQLDPSDQYKMVFVCYYGEYKCIVTLFGLKNALAHF